MQVKINSTVLELTVGDITDLDSDAIVNAANNALQLRGRSGWSGQTKRRAEDSGRM
jgi:O-acetyl-ADP-ribose deacetylase (regulator of RNase III)